MARGCGSGVLLGLAAAVALGHPAQAREPARARFDALAAAAEARDPNADPQGYLAAQQAALAEARRVFPAGHPALAAQELRVATGLAANARLDEAAPIVESVLPRLEAAGDAYLQPLGEALSLTGYIANLRGDHGLALSCFERQVALFARIDGGAPSKDHAVALSNLAGALWEAGQAGRSLDLNARAIAMGRTLRVQPPETLFWYGNRMAYLRTAGRMDDAIAAGQEALAFAGPAGLADHPAMANVSANLASLLVQVGRPNAAIPLARRAFEQVEAAAGKPSQNSAAMRAIFAVALTEAGRFDDAVTFLDAAIPIIEGEIGPEANRSLQARENRARALSRLGRHAEALETARAVLAVRDRKLPATHQDRMAGRALIARMALSARDLPLAEAMAGEAVALRAAAVPPDHPDLLFERSLLLLVQSRRGSAAPGVLAAQAREVLDRLVANGRRNPAAAMPVQTRSAFQALAEVLMVAGDGEGAFEAQQWSARTSVDDAAAAGAMARLAEGRPDAAAPLERRRALLAERLAVLGQVNAQLSAPREGFDLAARTARLAAIDGELGEVDAGLAAMGISLSGFAPLTLADLRARLKPGEALLQASLLADGYGLTLVTRDGALQAMAGSDAAQVAAMAAALRASLDPSDPSRPFDRAAASGLYRALFPAAAERHLRGVKRLYLAANGALGAVPFAALAPRESGRELLVDRMAIARLPGAAGLARSSDAGAVTAMTGFGAPDGGAGDPLALRGLPALAPLPEAARELRDIAAAAGIAEPLILTGAQATEAALRSAQVRKGGVLAFATHGLVSGEVEGLREPALVLGAGQGDDGLLTASEIARLNLPARWVILSACNTAASAGPDAPGLSGLAQAFMLAGAGDILATHWRVRDDVARAITAETMRAAAAGAPPADALRSAILALRKGGLPGAGHPALWAAFEVIQ